MLFSHMCTSTHITGAEKLLLFLVKELQPFHECVLVVPNEGVLSAEARSNGIRVAVHPFPVLWQMYSPTASLRDHFEQLIRDGSGLRSMMKLIHGFRPDFIVANTCVNPLPAFTGKAMGIPVMWIITETIRPTAYASLAIRIIDRAADRIVGISHTTLKPFYGIIPAPKLGILYPTLRMDDLKPNRWEANRKQLRDRLRVADHERLVSYISSNIYPMKGLEHFLHAAQSLCHSFPNVKCLIVGKPSDDDFYRRCLSLIEESPHAKRFITLPFVSRIEEAYPAMDIVIVPSLVEEGFGMTALEGMAFGKPVVAYRSGGLEEILGQTANETFLAPTGEWNRLAQIARGLLQDEQLLRETGARNSAAVHSVFGVDAYRARLRELIRPLFVPPAASKRSGIRGKIGKDEAPALLIRGKRKRAFLLDRGVRYPLAFRKRARLKLKRLPKTVKLPDRIVNAFPLGPIVKVNVRSASYKRKKNAKGKRKAARKRR